MGVRTTHTTRQERGAINNATSPGRRSTAAVLVLPPLAVCTGVLGTSSSTISISFSNHTTKYEVRRSYCYYYSSIKKVRDLAALFRRLVLR